MTATTMTSTTGSPDSRHRLPLVWLCPVFFLWSCTPVDETGGSTGDDTSPPNGSDDTTVQGDDDSQDDDASLDDDATAGDDSASDDDTVWKQLPNGDMLLVVEIGGNTFEFTGGDDEGQIQIWNATPAPGEPCTPAWYLHVVDHTDPEHYWMVTLMFASFPATGLETDVTVPVEAPDEDVPYVKALLPLIFEDQVTSVFRAVQAGTATLAAVDADGIDIVINGARVCQSDSYRYGDLEESTDCEDVASVAVHLLPNDMWPEDFAYLLDYFAGRDPYPSSEDSWGDGWCLSETNPIDW